MNIIYRIYADGTVLHQDDFEETDNLEFRDDYQIVAVPEEIVGYIEDMVLGK